VFDTGPDSRAFERNYASFDVANTTSIDRVVLSHWHRDHSGAITSLVTMLKAQRDKDKPNAINESVVTVDLHPDRPIARGMAPRDKVIARLPEDPSLQELEAAGARLELHREGHAVGDGAVWVSGEIPRVTDFETGLLGGMRWYEDQEEGKGEWRPEPVSAQWEVGLSLVLMELPHIRRILWMSDISPSTCWGKGS
jgi:7,8-dihydropterin-6-yl-methyl-4-(beta-D-ribofuranosyl)aminobenzene 5'-phosphate synthase